MATHSRFSLKHLAPVGAASVAFGYFWLANVASAEPRKFDEVVAIEAAGKPINRREALLDEQDPQSQWQAGRVMIDGQWLAIEDLQGHKLASQVTSYQKERKARSTDVDENRRMARWCRSHQLPDMAEIHWKAVVAVEVNDEQARKELGHKRIDGKWLTKEELLKAAEDQDLEEQALKQWMPQIRKIVAQLNANDAKKKLDALAKLDEVNDPLVVSGLKYAALQVEPSVAVPLVTKIKSVRSRAACLALCELALQNPNAEVGRAAIEGLREYDEHFYVPELLQLLELPVKFEQENVYMPNGSFVTRRAFLRESVDAKKHTDILRLVSVKRDEINLGISVLTGSPIFTIHVMEHPQVKESSKVLIEVERRQTEKETEVQNTLARQQEVHTRQLLSAISGVPQDAPANAFWDWWPSFNEDATGEKETTYETIIDNSKQVITNGFIIRSHNCLIAGTLVQSLEGLKPVEQFCIGDQVISTNCESGQISPKSVTYVSERVADSTFVLTFINGEKIRVTGGHNWWVIGRGWIRSRDLEKSQSIRTSNASLEIASVEKIDEPIKVYNMVVDENHTYFVGKDRLLSWDVTSLKPTLQKAPGQFVRRGL